MRYITFNSYSPLNKATTHTNKPPGIALDVKAESLLANGIMTPYKINHRKKYHLPRLKLFHYQTDISDSVIIMERQ